MHPFTENYTSMAATATELQDLWKSTMYLQDGDFVRSRNSNDPKIEPAIIQIQPGEARDGWTNPEWIPTTNQLGDLLLKKDLAYHSQGHPPRQKNYYNPAQVFTVEELIEKVMLQRYGKRWDGNRWVKGA